MKIYVGIDLHSNNSYFAVINELGERLFNKRVNNKSEEILKVMNKVSTLGLVEDLVIESTYNWFWLVDLLQANKYPVSLANPSQIHQYSGMKITTDKSDAFFLAELSRLKILPRCWICSPEERATRELLRSRMFLVQKRTSMKTSLSQLVTRYTGERISGTKIVKMNKTEREKLLCYPDTLFRAEHLVRQINSFDVSISDTEKHALQQVKIKPEYEYLVSVPGIGPVLALTIILETGDISRFKKSSHYTSYCRCVNSARFSNGKQKGSNNKKNGNKYLSWAYSEAALRINQYSDGAHRYFQRKVSKTHKMVAYKSLAAKLSKACYHILKNKEVYKEDKIFH